MELLTYLKVRTVSVCLFLCLAVACQRSNTTTTTTTTTADLATVQVEEYYKLELGRCAEILDSMLLAPENMQANYKRARAHFKRVEVVLAFAEKDNYGSLMHANLPVIDEEDATNVRIAKPFGLQVLEEQLFPELVDGAAIRQNLELTINRLRLIRKNTNLRLKPYHVLWCLRSEIVRVATIGVTGFDSPVLEHSLTDAEEAYRGMRHIMELMKDSFRDKELYFVWLEELRECEHLNDDDAFNTFDRYAFMKRHVHKQLRLIVRTQTDWECEFPYELALSRNVESLFTDSTFNNLFFAGKTRPVPKLAARVALGKRLFNDQRLSADNNMSCATCHNADKAFTDGLATFAKQTRNTPTLTYAGLQKGFFHDGRAGSLEGQIVGVVLNENEFHTQLSTITKAIETDSNYIEAFDVAFGAQPSSVNFREAIADYVRTLSPFSSSFDKSMNANENMVSERVISGYNLFTGKAKCATCHFPPLFNGTVPPNFKDSEFEAIGTPKDSLEVTEISTDLGRFNLYKTTERKFHFKTPTVRNVALTAPYMHNGVFRTLEQVVDFYNDGGGAGRRVTGVLNQTLPADSLHLTSDEKEDLVLFLESLTDE